MTSDPRSKSQDVPAADPAQAPKKQPPAQREVDHRGVVLPARSPVGGIITPQ